MDEGLALFGHVDVVVCNAGYMAGYGLRDPDLDTLMRAFQDNVDTMLTGVNTKFVNNETVERIARANEGWKNAMPVGLLEPVDVSNAVIWLCSEEAKYVTGVELPVDAGFLVKV